MLKKLTSLLLSFLLCLSLLPGHAYAANEPDLPQPPVIEEPLGPEPPEEPVMVMSEEVGRGRRKFRVNDKLRQYEKDRLSQEWKKQPIQDRSRKK